MHAGLFFEPIIYHISPSALSVFLSTVIINLAGVSLAAVLVFSVAGEGGRLLKSRKSALYVALATMAGIPIDLLYIYLCSRFYVLVGGSSLFFYDMFRSGYGSHYDHSYLLVPSIVAFVLLLSVHLVMVHYVFFRDIRPYKALGICAGVAAITTPLWSLLYFLYRARFN